MRLRTNTHTHACTHCQAKDGVDYEGAVSSIITSQQLPYSEVNWEFKAGTSVVIDVTGCVWALQFYAEVGVGGSVGAPQFYTEVDTEMYAHILLLCVLALTHNHWLKHLLILKTLTTEKHQS